MKKEEKKQLDDILKAHDYNKTSVIAIMQDIQKIYHYLPQEVLTYIAGELGLSEAKVYGVATFYENFSLEPKGKYVIKICDGTACHVRKSAPILEALFKELGLSKKKHTTDDMLFTVETVSCLGACGLAPTMMVNEEVHPKMTPEKAIALIEELRGEGRRELTVRKSYWNCVRLSRRSSQPVTAGFLSVPAPAVLPPVHRRFMRSFLKWRRMLRV